MKNLPEFIAATEEYATHEHSVAAPLFRGVFRIEEKGKVKVSICGLGFYRLFLNGTEITRGRLASYPSNPDRIYYCDTYGVTDQIQMGDNVLGILLGNGMLNCIGGEMWDFDKVSYRSAPKTSFQVCVEDRVIFSSEHRVKVHPSPILYDDLREGETYDARQEIPGWCEAGYDDSTWADAILAVRPKGICAVNQAPPILVAKEHDCVRLSRAKEGYVYEFPVNTAGICRLRIKGERGQKITMQYVEALDASGNPFMGNLVFGCTRRSQQNVYICKGGDEVYEPSFTYHGFRYVYITGMTEEQARPEALVMLELHGDITEKAKLETSDEIVNRLCAMIGNSDLSNLLHFPTDCPQREKNGWAGDLAGSANQMALRYDVYGILREWLRNYRVAQREDGALPGYVPTGDCGYEVWTGPSWSMALYLTVYYLYRYHGGKEIIEENAEAMERYLAYVMEQKNEDGLIAFGLGDWCQTTVDYADRHTTPNEITDTLAAVCMTELVDFLLRQTGWNSSVDYKKMNRELRDCFRRKWIAKDGYSCGCDSQTAQAMCLYYHIFSSEKEEAAFRELVDRIERANRLMDVGILGGYVLFDVLSAHGRSDLAYQLIVQERAPSYGYFARRGETTLRESLMGHGASKDATILQNGMTIASLNHRFWGFVYTWFVERLAGVTINGDCSNVNSAQIEYPSVLLDKVEFEYAFPCGKLRVQWTHTGAGSQLSLHVPKGAAVSLRAGEMEERLTDGVYIRNVEKERMNER